MRRVLTLLLVLLLVGVVAYLVFAYYGKAQPAAQNMIQSAADVATTGKVKSNFALSKRLSGYDISVDTHNDVVTLIGQVPSEIDKELAESVAADTTGVQSVVNQLQVEPGLPPSEAGRRASARVADLEIKADLREKLANSTELRGQSIQINVQDRVVTLSGQVATTVQKNGAEQVTRSITAVSNVINNLAVTEPAAPDSEPAVASSAIKDQDLAKAVLFALFSERQNFRDVGAIKVESRDGLLVLTGQVASRAESALAVRIARDTQGVRKVENRLSVLPSN